MDLQTMFSKARKCVELTQGTFDPKIDEIESFSRFIFGEDLWGKILESYSRGLVKALVKKYVLVPTRYSNDNGQLLFFGKELLLRLLKEIIRDDQRLVPEPKYVQEARDILDHS